MRTLNFAVPHASVIASYHLWGERWLLLIYRGGFQPYVVTTYQGGAEEWESGRYFEHLQNASLAFVRDMQHASGIDPDAPDTFQMRQDMEPIYDQDDS